MMDRPAGHDTVLTAHVLARIVHHAAPHLAPRSSLECADQFRAALASVRTLLAEISSADHASRPPSESGFDAAVWTLALVLGTCVRLYLNSGPYGHEIRSVPVKVEAVARSIGKMAGLIRAQLDTLSDAGEMRAEKAWLLGLHTFLVSHLHTCPPTPIYRPFAHQLLLLFHDLDPGLATVPTALLYPANALASLAPHLVTRFAVPVPTVLHAAHRMLSLATLHFSAYPPPTPDHAYLMHCALRMLGNAAVLEAMRAYPVFLVTLMRALAEYISDPDRPVSGAFVDREAVGWMVKVQLRYAKAAATRADWDRVLQVGGQEKGRARSEVLVGVVAAVEEAVCRAVEPPQGKIRSR